MSAVSIRNISRRFGSAAAVAGIDLDVEEGQFVTFLGPSGCGKTTTLRMIAGLERNDSGTIAIAGQTVSDAQRGLFVPPEKRNAGMVFQSYAIWPHMTVFDNVAYPLRVRRMAGAEVQQRTQEALRTVEMGPYAERSATALSGGQQQRVAIARAIVFAPKVLLLDEPLSNLDARLREQMRSELRGLQQRLGITTVYVTHDQEEAMALSDRIIVMSKGRILQDADPESVYFRPSTVEVAAFCGSPNIVAGRVLRSQASPDGISYLQVAGAGWQGWARAGAAIAEGSEISIVVRPEYVEISPMTADAPERSDERPGIQWQGQVVENMFRGFRRTLRVDCGATRILVDMPADLDVAKGQKVRLSVPAERTWILKEPTANEPAARI